MFFLIKLCLHRQVLGITLPALDIFRKCTIADLSEEIESALAEQHAGNSKRSKLRNKMSSGMKRLGRLLPGKG